LIPRPEFIEWDRVFEMDANAEHIDWPAVSIVPGIRDMLIIECS